MAQNVFSHIRLVVKRSSRLMKIAVIAAVVLATATLLVLHSAKAEAKAQAEALRTQASQLEQDNRKLKKQISSLGTVESAKDIAQEVLGLVDPDTIVYQPED